MKIEVNRNFRYYPEDNLWIGWVSYNISESIEDERFRNGIIEILTNYDFVNQDIPDVYVKKYDNQNISSILIQMDQDKNQMLNELENLYKDYKQIKDQRFYYIFDLLIF